jgi:hypothetical protein
MKHTNVVRIIGAVALVSAMTANFAKADNDRDCKPRIAPPNSQPQGLSYNEWEMLALQWYFSTPTTVEKPPGRVICHMVVPPPAGFTGVTIPLTLEADQWLLVPIWFTAWANTPGDFGYDHPWSTPYEGYPTYEAWARDQLKAWVDTQVPPTSTIDGKPVQNLDKYRMQTGLFELTLPTDNAWGILAGTYGPCFGEGWFAIIRPMKPGKHTVTNAVGEGQFVTYKITVTREHHDGDDRDGGPDHDGH